MSERVKKYYSELRRLNKALPRVRNLSVKNCDDEFILCICELAFNLYKGNIHLNSTQFNSITGFAERIQELIDRKTTIDEKRKILNKSCGLLPAILEPSLAFLETILE